MCATGYRQHYITYGLNWRGENFQESAKTFRSGSYQLPTPPAQCLSVYTGAGPAYDKFLFWQRRAEYSYNNKQAAQCTSRGWIFSGCSPAEGRSAVTLFQISSNPSSRSSCLDGFDKTNSMDNGETWPECWKPCSAAYSAPRRLRPPNWIFPANFAQLCSHPSITAVSRHRSIQPRHTLGQFNLLLCPATAAWPRLSRGRADDLSISSSRCSSPTGTLANYWTWSRTKVNGRQLRLAAKKLFAHLPASSCSLPT